MEIPEITKRLFRIPFDPVNSPDPMVAPFDPLERNVQGVLNELWDNREQWQDDVTDLHPIWIASLRMTAMYLNMSDAFHGCGGQFMEEAVGDETPFLEKYQNCEPQNKLQRACLLLARTVSMLRILGWRCPENR